MAPTWSVALAVPAGAIVFLGEDAQALVDLGTVGRWIEYAGLLLALGAIGWLFTSQRALKTREEVYQAALRSGRRAAILGGTVLLLAALVRLQAQVLAFRFPGDPLTASAYRDMLETSWGHGWLAQVASALAIAIGAALARPATRAWVTVLAGAATLVVTTALTGHAVGGEVTPFVSVPLHAAHVAGGATWLGTLFLLMVAGFGISSRLADGERESVRADLVASFSPLALIGAGVAVSAGIVLSLLYLGSVSALWQTTYGRLLIAKVVSLLGAAALGAYNWRRLRPRLGAAGASAELRRSAVWELFFGSLLLAVTGMLVAQPMGG